VVRTLFWLNSSLTDQISYRGLLFESCIPKGGHYYQGGQVVARMRRLELYTTVKTDEDAIVWCRERGLLLRTCVCSECGSDMREEQDSSIDRRIWRCRKTINGRRHQLSTSIRAGSFIARHKIGVPDAVYLLYEWAVDTPASKAAYGLQISENTVSKFFLAMRRVCAWAVDSRLELQIGGAGSIVELDECQLGRRKAHRGRIPQEVWAFGGILRDFRPPRCFIEIVQRRDELTLLSVIRRRVHPLSQIVTDGWGAYRNLQTYGFQHQVVNHSANFVSPDDRSVHTQNIENLWGCLMKFLRHKGTNTRKHLSSYLSEFIFRRSFVDPFETSVSFIEIMQRDNWI